MNPILLKTKLYIPAVRDGQISRPHLIARLHPQPAKPTTKLVLISAPAGYGKTTLVAEWIQQVATETPVCWLSLDEEDDDPLRFFHYLSAAVAKLEGGQTTLTQILSTGQPRPPKQLMGALINDLSDVSDRFLLVLDDYHVLDSAAIDDAIAFLLSHMPPQMTLVLVSRSDPGFPLSRLRAAGDLLELRAADLRFTDKETIQFLQDVMGLSLTVEQIQALDDRTEGWVAGLQMAALSLQNRQDVAGFIDHFAGSHRFVIDFLLEEVLEQQPAEVVQFLLETAVLDRFCAELCEAVRQTSGDGRSILQALETKNLFLIPLDNERGWYRYHHLFADLLRQRLEQARAESPQLATATELHQRASQWFEGQGLEAEAFQHAAAAEDVSRALRLVDGEGSPIYLRGMAWPVLYWLAGMPPQIRDNDHRLLITYASAMIFSGDGSRAEMQLGRAETMLEGMVVNDENRDWIGRIAMIRAMLAISHDLADTIVAEAQRARDYLAADNRVAHTMTAWALGYAYHVQGDRRRARQAYQDVLATSEVAGYDMFRLGAMVSLGQVQQLDHELRLAFDTFTRTIEAAGDPPLAPACEAYLGLGRLYYEWNKLDQAKDHAGKGLAIALQIDEIDTPASCYFLLAQVALAERDGTEAQRLLTAAEQSLQKFQFEHRASDLIAAKVALCLFRGDVTAAVSVAEALPDSLSRARVYIAEGNGAAALPMLERLEDEAVARPWPDVLFAVRLCLVLTHDQLGDRAEAEKRLHALLNEGEREGFLRSFIDMGAEMAELLSGLSSSHDYSRTILGAFDSGVGREAPAEPLIDPLSEREIEILAHIAAGLKNKEIAAELFVSVNTIYYHTKNIYGKLGVNSRTQAVAKAKSLRLI